MTTTTNELISRWRSIGPDVWAESPYGWLDETGQPIRLEPWQKAVLVAWFENREVTTTLAISNVKKTGKTLANALITCWRWLALPGAHFCIGNDLDQASARQFAEIVAMVKRHPYLKTVCKIYKNSITFEPTGSTLTALAVDAAGNAGSNHLTASHTEAWGIIYEAGIRAWEELTTPPGRFYGLPALRVVDSYAGFEGESKTWHNLVDRGLAGERLPGEWPIFQVGGLLLFHAEGEWARAHCYRGSQQEAEVYYADQQRDLRPNAFLRMHGNQRTAGESAFVAPEAWEACRASIMPIQPGEKVKLVVGADASTSGDFTSLVGTVYNHQTGLVDVRLVKVWKPVRIAGVRFGKATIDIDETIGQAVLELFHAGQLKAVVCDVFQLHTCVIKWQRAGIPVVELNQNAGRIDSDQALYNAINAGTLRHFNDPALNDAVRNAVARETPRGFRLDKERASKKIDPAVALSMSHWGSRIHYGAVDDSGPGWQPDPFDGGPELETVRQWELEAGRPWGDSWHIHHEPHPEGVNSTNCRRQYCLACYQESEAARDAEAEFYRDYVPLSQESYDQFRQELRNPYRQPEPPVNQETIRTFWKNVKGK